LDLFPNTAPRIRVWTRRRWRTRLHAPREPRPTKSRAISPTPKGPPSPTSLPRSDNGTSPYAQNVFGTFLPLPPYPSCTPSLLHTRHFNSLPPTNRFIIFRRPCPSPSVLVGVSAQCRLPNIVWGARNSATPTWLGTKRRTRFLWAEKKTNCPEFLSIPSDWASHVRTHVHGTNTAG
jgi:hypothetical protein